MNNLNVKSKTNSNNSSSMAKIMETNGAMNQGAQPVSSKFQAMVEEEEEEIL